MVLRSQAAVHAAVCGVYSATTVGQRLETTIPKPGGRPLLPVPLHSYPHPHPWIYAHCTPSLKCNWCSPQRPLTRQPIPLRMHPHSQALYHNPLRGTTNSATPTPRSSVPKTQQQQVGTKGVAQPELASTKCVAIFAAPQPLATWGPARRMQAGAQSAPRPRTGCGPPPRPCVVRLQPHATPVAVQNFPYLPYNLTGMISHLGLHAGRPRKAFRRPYNSKCTKIPGFWL